MSKTVGDTPTSGLSVTIRLKNVEDAKRVAVAIQLLRYYGVTYGDDQAVQVADQATDAIQNLTV